MTKNTVGGTDGVGSPMVRVVDEVVEVGNGASLPVSVYYLNQEGALLVLTRLRTPRAIEATKQVVGVFMAAARGELPPHLR